MCGINSGYKKKNVKEFIQAFSAKLELSLETNFLKILSKVLRNKYNICIESIKYL